MEDIDATISESMKMVMDILIENGQSQARIAKVQNLMMHRSDGLETIPTCNVNSGGLPLVEQKQTKEGGGGVIVDTRLEEKALVFLQRNSHCLPYMDTERFINAIANVWENLSVKNVLARRNAQKALLVVRNDPKIVDSAIVQAAEAAYEEMIGNCTRCNMEVYRVRALKGLYSTKG